MVAIIIKTTTKVRIITDSMWCENNNKSDDNDNNLQ